MVNLNYRLPDTCYMHLKFFYSNSFCTIMYLSTNLAFREGCTGYPVLSGNISCILMTYACTA